MVLKYFFEYREEVGLDVVRKFLGYIQWFVNYWFLQQGFSIGIGDIIVDVVIMEVINEIIFKVKNEVKNFIRIVQEKQLEFEFGRIMMESFENRVNQVFNNIGFLFVVFFIFVLVID